MQIWEKMGFRDNPYDKDSLEVSEQGSNLFIDRDSESKYFQTVLSSASGGLVMVEGDVGVGKTSFINIQQYQSLKKKDDMPYLLPCFETVEICEPIDTFQILLSVLSHCFQALESILKDEIKKDDRLNEISRLIGQSILSSLSWQAGVSIPGGAGGSVGLGSTKTQTVPAGVSAQILINALDNMQKIIREKYGFEGVYVLLNNLNVISDSGIVALFDRMRDIFVKRKNFWWILLARKGIFSMMERESSRASEMFNGEPIVLAPLPWPEIERAIDLRIKYFRTREDAEPPVPIEIVHLLYDISKGEIMYIFKRITDLVINFKSKYPSTGAINYDEALLTLRQLAAERLKEQRSLSKTDWVVLEKMADAGEFRPKDFQWFGLKSAQSLNKYIQKFLELNLLYRFEEGKASIYRCAGDVKLYYQKK